MICYALSSRLSLALPLLMLLVLVSSSRAASAGSDDERKLIWGPGGTFDYQLRVVEISVERYGRIALHDYDQLPDDSRPLARQVPAAAPAGWPRMSLAGQPETLRGRAAFGGKREGERCDCATDLGNPDERRVAVLYATAEVEVSADAFDAHTLLELRIRYHDGVVVFVNGREVARRNLDDPARVSAVGLRGPEWEQFVVPVSAANLVPGKNLLAVEVRPSDHRQIPYFDVELGLVSARSLVRGPMVQRVSEREASIVFHTPTPVSAAVEYGFGPSLGRRVQSADGALARRHEVRIPGLEAGRAVHYRVVVDGVATEPFIFHTPPGRNEPVRFAVYGDMRGGHRVHGQLVSALLDEAVDFVIATGDLVLRGSDEADWQRFFSVARELLSRVAFYPVAGNHDLGTTGDERRRMNEIFALWPGPSNRPIWGSWHSFEVAGVHFVMLDSNSYQHEEQLQWLEADLAAARKRGVRAIFAATHDGPYSRGIHRGNRYAAEHYAPVLRKYGVSLLFAGHDHLYQRGEVEGLPYIVSGGAGAPLYSVRCGVAGKPRCQDDDGMLRVERAHHYVIVTVFPTHVSACPKYVDKTPLEPCVRYSLDIGRRPK